MGTSDNNLTLIRHNLGSIDLSDIPKKEMTESERKEYCAAISAVFPRLERDIKEFIQSQLEFQGRNAGHWDHVTFSRGCVNAYDLLLEHWRQAHAEHSEPKGDEFDKNEVLPEI